MKLTNLIYSFLLIKNGVFGEASTIQMEPDTSVCSKPYIRKEIRDMTETEIEQFITALKTLRANGFWDKIVKIHVSANNYAHFTPVFLPYHRLLLRIFEQEIQKIYPNLFLPFWNWAKDSQDPEKSIVFTNEYFGGNGNKTTYIVDTGPFANDTIRWPVVSRLKRQFNEGDQISSFPAVEHLEVLINDALNYKDFNEQIGMNPHAAPHENIGGDNGELSIMSSPGDPLFFLHHCFIDMLWWNWQKRKGSIVGNTYEGINANIYDPIIPWGTPVYKLFDTRSYGSCFDYPEFNVVLPETLKVNKTRRVRPSMRNKKPLKAKKEKDDDKEENDLKSLMAAIQNGDVIGERVHHTDRRTKKGKIRSPKHLSSKIMKMFKINKNKAAKQTEKFDLISQALNIADNHVGEAELREGDPEDKVSPRLKKWANTKKFGKNKRNKLH